MRRIISLILSAVMVLALLTTNQVFAAEAFTIRGTDAVTAAGETVCGHSVGE